VYKSIQCFAGLFALALAVGSGAAVAADDEFPLTGKYTQNVACKGDGTDAQDVLVTISPKEIVSNVGVCTILDAKRDGTAFDVHIECKFPAGPLIGDINFKPRPDKTIEFIDRDGNYKAVLYRCPK
jgi:hypothetical protein